MISCIGNLMKQTRLPECMDDWKMVVKKKGTPFLYNLKTDIHEDTDIALQHPDVEEKMKAIIFEQHTPSIHISQWPLPKQ